MISCKKNGIFHTPGKRKAKTACDPVFFEYSKKSKYYFYIFTSQDFMEYSMFQEFKTK